MSNVEFLRGEPVAVNVIEHLEQQLGIVFPESYKQVVMQHNGAYVLPGAFIVENRVESINNLYNVHHCYEFTDERLPDTIVPFGRDAGDNYLCFDFRQTESVPILFWDHEIEDINDSALSLVADSFDEFLTKLFESEEE